MNTFQKTIPKITIKKNISITDFCSVVGIRRSDFIDFLIEHKYIYRSYYGEEKERYKNVAFPRFDTTKGMGLFEMNKKPSNFNRNKSNINIQITPKGFIYFSELLKKEGLIKNGNYEY